MWYTYHMNRWETKRENRFWSQIERRSEQECWPWLGKVDKDGYGFFWCERPKIQRSHRYMFYKTNGYLPEVVRHTCDNPNCNNPNHLLGGTQGDNNRDTVERGRWSCGWLKDKKSLSNK